MGRQRYNRGRERKNKSTKGIKWAIKHSTGVCSSLDIDILRENLLRCVNGVKGLLLACVLQFTWRVGKQDQSVMSLNNNLSHPEGNYTEVNEQRMTPTPPPKKINGHQQSIFHASTQKHIHTYLLARSEMSSLTGERVAHLYTPPACSDNMRAKLHFNGLSLLLAPLRLWVYSGRMNFLPLLVPVQFCLTWSRILVDVPAPFYNWGCTLC